MDALTKRPVDALRFTDRELLVPPPARSVVVRLGERRAVERDTNRPEDALRETLRPRAMFRPPCIENYIVGIPGPDRLETPARGHRGDRPSSGELRWLGATEAGGPGNPGPHGHPGWGRRHPDQRGDLRPPRRAVVRHRLRLAGLVGQGDRQDCRIIDTKLGPLATVPRHKLRTSTFDELYARCGRGAAGAATAPPGCTSPASASWVRPW